MKVRELFEEKTPVDDAFKQKAVADAKDLVKKLKDLGKRSDVASVKVFSGLHAGSDKDPEESNIYKMDNINSYGQQAMHKHMSAVITMKDGTEVRMSGGLSYIHNRAKTKKQLASRDAMEPEEDFISGFSIKNRYAPATLTRTGDMNALLDKGLKWYSDKFGDRR